MLDAGLAPGLPVPADELADSISAEPLANTLRGHSSKTHTRSTLDLLSLGTPGVHDAPHNIPALGHLLYNIRVYLTGGEDRAQQPRPWEQARSSQPSELTVSAAR